MKTRFQPVAVFSSEHDPFEQLLTGRKVMLMGPVQSGGWYTSLSRTGVIVKHEMYDTDHCLSVQRVSVRWDDDGTVERRSPRDWHYRSDGSPILYFADEPLRFPPKSKNRVDVKFLIDSLNNTRRR